MHISKSLGVLLLQLALSNPITASCGDADACIGTEFCTTATFTAPISTTVTTCVPTPTCLTVYQDCVSGGGGPGCCSTICAATKCRPANDEWPGCREDMGPCLADENCCYENQCVDGLCQRS
ncbi:hypothetical protein FE257_004432 [Aspergillus nanangensis]|uniref:Uncharacterized protein n=1 Tax=Aspergillus nanangensis TaxID=2582783 RepID=A0AAD4CY11_ASPNN|nr:hypothetical protein FE257_004432 [Aspergillus nanangensis]